MRESTLKGATLDILELHTPGWNIYRACTDDDFLFNENGRSGSYLTSGLCALTTLEMGIWASSMVEGVSRILGDYLASTGGVLY